MRRNLNSGITCLAPFSFSFLKYEILGQLTGPNGVTGWVRTIWIVRHGEENPRLVTLIPEEKP